VYDHDPGDVDRLGWEEFVLRQWEHALLAAAVGVTDVSPDDLGILRRLLGDYAGAAEVLEEALRICRDLGDHDGQSEMLAELEALASQAGESEP